MRRLNELARAGRRGNLRGVRGCTSMPWGTADGLRFGGPFRCAVGSSRKS